MTYAITDDELHILARDQAERLVDPDRKQLRFNDIVLTARSFYRNPKEGVVELIRACDRDDKQLYIHKQPMWKMLREQYSWMIEEDK